MDVFPLVLKACGIGVLAALCLVVIGQMSHGYATVLRICGALLLFGIFLLVLEGSVSAIEEAFFAADDIGVASEAFETMLKALGVALTSRFCSDVCRDCGEGTLAGAVESVGRIAIFALAVPTMVKLLGTAREMLQMIE